MFRYIFSLHLLILICSAAFAQDSCSDSLDVCLDEYEAICAKCMDLKVRLASGENVSRAEAQSFICRFLTCNRSLKSRTSEMTAIQNRRFSSIGKWFSSGVRPEPEVPPMLPQLSPVSSLCRPSHSYVLAQPPVSDYIPEETVDGSDHDRFYLLASASVPDLSYGVMLGYRHRRWGGYLSFRSNFIILEPTYECLSDGSLAGGGSFWPGGAESKSHLSACGGCLYGLNDMFTIYAGAGYGWRKVAWEDIDGAWAEVSDISHEGLAIDAGLLLTFHHLALSAGISSIAFRTAVFNVGLGVRF